MSTPPAGAVDITTLPTPQLSQLQSRLSADLDHLTTSHTRLRAAQSRFRDCIRSIEVGILNKEKDASPLLIPLTPSLYIPATKTTTTKTNNKTTTTTPTVLVDIGTGFYIEKTPPDARRFYAAKVDDLSVSLGELDKVVGSKGENLRVVEDVLRQKVMAEQQQQQQGQGQGSGGAG